MGDDVMQVQLDGTRRVTPLVHSPFDDRNGTVSYDGRWLAHESMTHAGSRCPFGTGMRFQKRIRM